MHIRLFWALFCALWLGIGCTEGDDDTGDDDVADDDSGGDDDTGPGDDDDSAAADADGDGWSVGDGDCDDGDAAVYPGADEGCDGIDTDCDGSPAADEVDGDADGAAVCAGDCDDGDATLNLADADGDGVTTCDGDCDDDDPSSYPEAIELCDGLDNDCDGSLPTDEVDYDGDGFTECGGDCNEEDASIHPDATEACNAEDDDCDGDVPLDEADDDIDGYLVCEGDCDDADPDTYPTAAELCDGVDNDCDGSLPPGEADDDLDSWRVCDGDCDDAVDDTYPGAAELCDGLDNDCDGGLPVDERDVDHDGSLACDGDCDDDDAATYPGAAEQCDGADNDCNGLLPANEDDGDADGFMVCEGDCDDTLDTIHPGATELCDGLDDDCDGALGADELDTDGDGFTACDGDCDEGDANVHPAAQEIPGNEIDEDCDGYVADPPVSYWTEIFPGPDPPGDASGYLVDLMDYEFHYDGQILELRITSWTNFSDNDPDLMVDLYVGDGTDYYCLTLDNVYPSPQPLQLWTSLNSWASAIANPPSLFMDTDDANSLVMGIDLADINLDGYTELEAQAAANLYGASGYDDLAPDAGYVTFAHVAGPNMETQTILVDDTAGGDGDHVAEGGELALLEVLLSNDGDTPTGANLTAVFTRDAGSTASFSVLGGTVTYSGGSPIGIGVTAVPDSDVRVDLDAGAVAGDTVVLQADLTDDDGNAWTIETLPLLVGVEAADIASGAPLVPSSSILTGDTDLLNNDYDQPLACTGYSAIGDEGVYRVQLTSGQELTAYLLYETYPPDATLYISDDPTDPDVNCLAGVDDVILDSYETLEFTAPATGTYLLVVDSFGYSGGGPYSLTLRF